MKINNNILMRSLPMVAAVLGKKYGVKVVVSGAGAHTDGNTIYIPGIDISDKPELINLVRGFLDHESAHIRYTDFKYLRSSKITELAMHIFNIIEDWRVENELVKQFPGCRGNFDWLIKHHFAGPVKVSNSPEEIVNYILYSVRSWDVPEVIPNRDKIAVVVESSFSGLIKKIEHVLGLVRSDCNSTKAAVAYAKLLVKLIEDHAKSNKQKKPSKQPRKSDQGNPTDTSKKSKEELNKEAIQGKRSKQLKQLVKTPSKSKLKDLGEMMTSRLNGESRSQPSPLLVAVEGSKTTQALSRFEVAEIKHSSIALHTRLQALLQSSVMKRKRPSRHGKLNASRLYKIGTDPKLFLKTEQSQGINSSVHVLFDISGSMRSRIALSTNACYAVADSLSKINGVDVAVTAFPANLKQEDIANMGDAATVFPVIKHGERIHTNFRMKATGTTPMGEAIWWALQQEAMREESRKIILIITDGRPDTMSNTIEAIDQGKKMGAEFYGIGICSSDIKTLLGNNSEVIHDIGKLPSALFSLLQNALLEKRR